MNLHKFFIGCLVITIFLSGFPTIAQAQDGLPGTPGFGYGACLDLEGHHIESAIQIANKYGLDWITIDLDWDRYWHDPDSSPNWEALDRVMHEIEDTNLAVMISITNAPAWAIDTNGPSAASTSELALRLARRYPDGILALEVFPAANTRYDPKVYAEILKSVHSALTSEGYDNMMIAAGIEPSAGKEQALNFLLELYNAGSVIHSPVVSLRLPAIAYNPKTAPAEVSEHTLRFYEEARQVMLDNGHQNGLIWITRFDWEPGGISSTSEQAIWLQQAYMTMRSQLYIGVASFYCLNDPASSTALLTPDGQATPVFDALGGLIAAEHNHLTITRIIDLSKSIQKIAQKKRLP